MLFLYSSDRLSQKFQQKTDVSFKMTILTGQLCLLLSSLSDSPVCELLTDPLFCFAVSISSKKRKGKERRGGTEGQRGSGSIHRQIQFCGKVNMWSGEYWSLAVSYQTTRELRIWLIIWLTIDDSDNTRIKMHQLHYESS